MSDTDQGLGANNLWATAVPSSRVFLGTAIWSFVLGLAIMATWSFLPPAPLPADAPATEFSAVRAFRYVEAIAREPHRSGTPAIRRVRDYLVGELDRLGLHPSVHRGVVYLDGRIYHGENLIARLPGRLATPAFMLMAHYDSVDTGPGAADDAAGVATLLETARALRAGDQLDHDLILDITDGEEIGLLGGSSFKFLPIASDVALMLNFEARGVSGPSFLFDTSPDNGWLIAELAKINGPILASSLMGTIYRAMPFRTDFDRIRKTVPGFNVAFVGDFPRYHTQFDDPAHLDLRSLQHNGVYALQLARHFANLDLTRVASSPDVTYLNPVGGWILFYPGWWVYPLTGLVIVWWLVVVWGGRRAGILPGKMLMRSLGAAAGLICRAGLAGLLITGLALFFRGVQAWYKSDLFAIAGLVALVTILLERFRHWEELEHPGLLAIGAASLGLPVLLVVTFGWPGAAFILHWPLLGLLLGMSAAGVFTGPPGRWFWPALVLGVIPAVLLGVPLVWMLHMALTVVGLPLVMMAGAAMGALLTPLLEPCRPAIPAWTARSGFRISGVIVVWALLSGSPSPERPMVDSLTYAEDRRKNSFEWFTLDGASDEWTAQFFPASGTVNRIPWAFEIEDQRRVASAPPASIPASAVEVAAGSWTTSGTHRLTILIRPASETAMMILYGLSPAPFTFLACEDHPLPIADLQEKLSFGGPGKNLGWQWGLDWLIVPDRPSSFTMEVASTSRIFLRTLDVQYKLPDLAKWGFQPRPPHLIPLPNTISFFSMFKTDTTLIRQVWVFP